MVSFNDALRLRDVVKQFVREEVNILRPAEALATVATVNIAAKTATVLFPGDSVAVPVKVEGVVPWYVGQIVRIAGSGLGRYVVGLVTNGWVAWDNTQQILSANNSNHPTVTYVVRQGQYKVIDGNTCILHFSLQVNAYTAHGSQSGHAISLPFPYVGSMAGQGIITLYDGIAPFFLAELSSAAGTDRFTVRRIPGDTMPADWDGIYARGTITYRIR